VTNDGLPFTLVAGCVTTQGWPKYLNCPRS